MQFLHLGFIVLCLLNFVGKYTHEAINGLALPAGDLRCLTVFARKHLPVIGESGASQQSVAQFCRRAALPVPQLL